MVHRTLRAAGPGLALEEGRPAGGHLLQGLTGRPNRARRHRGTPRAGGGSGAYTRVGGVDRGILGRARGGAWGLQSWVRVHRRVTGGYARKAESRWCHRLGLRDVGALADHALGPVLGAHAPHGVHREAHDGLHLAGSLPTSSRRRLGRRGALFPNPALSSPFVSATPSARVRPCVQLTLQGFPYSTTNRVVMGSLMKT